MAISIYKQLFNNQLNAFLMAKILGKNQLQKTDIFKLYSTLDKMKY